MKSEVKQRICDAAQYLERYDGNVFYYDQTKMGDEERNLVYCDKSSKSGNPDLYVYYHSPRHDQYEESDYVVIKEHDNTTLYTFTGADQTRIFYETYNVRFFVWCKAVISVSGVVKEVFYRMHGKQIL